MNVNKGAEIWLKFFYQKNIICKLVVTLELKQKVAAVIHSKLLFFKMKSLFNVAMRRRSNKHEWMNEWDFKFQSQRMLSQSQPAFKFFSSATRKYRHFWTQNCCIRNIPFQSIWATPGVVSYVSKKASLFTLGKFFNCLLCNMTFSRRPSSILHCSIILKKHPRNRLDSDTSRPFLMKKYFFYPSQTW